MDLRRLSGILTIAAGVCTITAATLVVSISWGVSSSESVDATGTVVFESHRTASILASSPSDAATLLAVAAGVAVVAGLLIRFGGAVGPVVVLVAATTFLFLAILSIGIFFAPAVGLFNAAALLALVARGAEASLPCDEPPAKVRG